jgi:hypothetical protein
VEAVSGQIRRVENVLKTADAAPLGRDTIGVIVKNTIKGKPLAPLLDNICFPRLESELSSQQEKSL